jgi:hypothetical protein
MSSHSLIPRPQRRLSTGRSKNQHPFLNSTAVSTTKLPKVLFFVPVGASNIEIMKGNVLALKKSYPPMSFFFAHYDGLEGQRAFASQDWYKKMVVKWCAYEGYKAEFIFKELVFQDRLLLGPLLRQYPFVWFAVMSVNAMVAQQLPDNFIDFSRMTTWTFDTLMHLEWSPYLLTRGQ